MARHATTKKAVSDDADVNGTDVAVEPGDSSDLDEGKIFDYITGAPLKDSDKEKVRQRIARAQKGGEFAFQQGNRRVAGRGIPEQIAGGEEPVNLGPGSLGDRFGVVNVGGEGLTVGGHHAPFLNLILRKGVNT